MCKVNIDTEFVSLSDLPVRSLSIGTATPEIPTVILLHGFTDSADTWRLVLEELANFNVHAVALDLPQFGDTPRSDRHDLTQLHKEFMSAVLGRYDTGSGVVLVGNSFGGWDSLHSVLTYPEKVRSVLAISPAGFETRGLVGLVSRVPQIFKWLKFGSRYFSHSPLLASLLLTAAYSVVGSNGKMPRELRKKFRSHVKNGDLLLWVMVLENFVKEITDPRALNISAIERPTHIIWGSHDWLLTASGAKIACAQNPKFVSFEIFPGTAHCAQIQHPDRVAEAILDLIWKGAC